MTTEKEKLALLRMLLPIGGFFLGVFYCMYIYVTFHKLITIAPYIHRILHIVRSTKVMESGSWWGFVFVGNKLLLITC